MTQSQQDYYNSLPDHDKDILRVAALKATDCSEYNIPGLVRSLHSETQMHVRSILKAAAEHKLLHRLSTYSSTYTATADFMVYVYPDTQKLGFIWTLIQGTSRLNYYTEDRIVTYFCRCLHALLYAPKQYKKEEQYFMDMTTHDIQREYYAYILQNPAYEKVLHHIHPSLLSLAATDIFDRNFNNLESSSDIVKYIDGVKERAGIKFDDSRRYYQAWEAAMRGDFVTASKLLNGYIPVSCRYICAIKEITQGNIEAGWKEFDLALKEQRKVEKNAQIPRQPFAAFFFFVNLLCLDLRDTMPIMQKLSAWMTKNTNSLGSIMMFQGAILGAMNDGRCEEVHRLMLRYMQETHADIFMLVAALAYYLAVNKKQPDGIMHKKEFTDLANKAAKNGFLVPAYELAYALQKWFGSDSIGTLLEDLKQKLGYMPVLSRTGQIDDWEKSLNILLGVKVGSKKDAEADKYRVVYFFNPKAESITPVQQTRQIRGWTAGRNIAMKTFIAGKAKNMTEQDLRIANAVKEHSDYSGYGYYNTYYEFGRDVFPMLAGHPYIFLDGGKGIAVEFAAGQPLVEIVRTDKGYKLSTDITYKDIENKIFIKKETNTRYLVYNLNAQQVNTLQIISKQSIVVPDAGKDKLVELLGTLSAQGLNVQSDLLAADNAAVEVREVPADSRIRVQLLPLGDGLKAELFCKPFGEHPPYCKPGKGGKMLIANDNGVQLQVSRSRTQEAANAATLMEAIQTLDTVEIDEDDLISFEDPYDSLHLLDILAKYPEICVVEWPEGERFRIRGTAGSGNMSVRLSSGVGWFDVEGELKVDENTVLTLQQLLALSSKSRGRFIELGSGEFLALSDQLKKQLDELQMFSEKDKKGVKINKFASVALGDVFDGIEDLTVDKAWRDFRNRVDSKKVDEAPVPATLQAELRTYQEEGFRWMTRLAEWESGVCLADDMGLGKTVQTLAILLHRAALGPALVVCPVSVLGNWISEAERFAPTLRFKTFGTVAGRKEVVDGLEAGDVLVMSYGLLQSENELMATPAFATAVLDEAHAIKNNATKTSKATMQLKAKFRIALTGTPIQNHLGEIWNIFNFLNPGLLGNLTHFTEMFVKPEDEKARKHLKKLISPFILRRTKSAVLEELPPKTEIVKKITLSDEEMAFYEALRRQAIEAVSNQDANHLQVLAEITKLRQASCNPQLVDANINIPSSKLATFLDIISELRENKHRALVFSQFVTHLAIVRKALDAQGIHYQYLDGSTPQPERERNVKAFQSGEGELFLISLKAGGLGLNLTAADFVIHLDPWWNPAVEDQASDRAHRIGQTRPVTIYRLVAEGTIEEKIIQLHNTKRDLADSLLEGSDQSARLSLKEMVAMIRGNG
jgi:superfamily II DNA or RNA helicase